MKVSEEQGQFLEHDGSARVDAIGGGICSTAIFDDFFVSFSLIFEAIPTVR
jgi:hypothetical protein